MNWDRTVIEPGTPSSRLVGVTIWLWIHRARMLSVLSLSTKKYWKWQLITGGYNMEKKNHTNAAFYTIKMFLKYI